MPVFLLKNEKKLSEVVTRVFGEVRAADRRRVESALVRANPHLAEPTGILPGIALVVPRVPGLEPAAAIRSEMPNSELVGELVGELERYHNELESAARQEKVDLTALVALYKSKELQLALRDLPEGAEQVKKVVAATKARIDEHARTVETLKQLKKAAAGLTEVGETLA